jgi:hypothetical protein
MSESFFEKYISFSGFNLNLFSNDFRVNHSREKIISYLKKNPQYKFDYLICEYI